MTSLDAADAGLTWNVLAMKRHSVTRDAPPGQEALKWVANSSTLICGQRDAVLVDTFLTIDQSQTLLDWVAASARNLTAIYVTHGHADHFYGLAPILERFPQARAVATAEVVQAMHEQLASASTARWHRLFPGQIPERLLAAEPLDGDRLTLEGYELVVVNAGHTDTARSTSLHVPSIGLIVAGDVVYSGIHPFLAETDTPSRLEWITALDRLQALKPRAVVAGHKVPERDDDPREIERTRRYLQDFNSLDEATKTATELYDAMLRLYPDRANPSSLWRGATAAKMRATRHPRA